MLAPIWTGQQFPGKVRIGHIFQQNVLLSKVFFLILNYIANPSSKISSYPRTLFFKPLFSIPLIGEGLAWAAECCNCVIVDNRLLKFKMMVE